MILAAIFAADQANAIGKNNQLLCHLPADLKFFKQTTMGSPVIMGRKTYESMGRLLPGRKNIIITRNATYAVPGAHVCQSLEEALSLAAQHLPESGKAFVIGGAEIFKMAMPQIHEIYRTVIQQRFEADTYMDDMDEQVFSMEWEECHPADEKNPHGFCFQKWVRN